MNQKSNITRIVFSFLISLALVVSAIVTTPAKASAPSAKVTPPPTATPTQTVTDTPVPTVEPAETTPAVSIQSNPTFISNGGQVTISYQISDYQKIIGTPGLRFYAPQGLFPADGEAGKWDDAERTLYLPLTDIEGKILWQADETITPPVAVTVVSRRPSTRPAAAA